MKNDVFIYYPISVIYLGISFQAYAFAFAFNLRSFFYNAMTLYCSTYVLYLFLVAILTYPPNPPHKSLFLQMDFLSLIFNQPIRRLLRFGWILSLILFFLFSTPCLAIWIPSGSREKVLSTAETRQETSATTDYITKKDLQEFARQMKNSWERLAGIDHSNFNDFQFPIEVDLIFRLRLGIKSNRSVLKDELLEGHIKNQQLTRVQRRTVKQPFVDSLPSSASSVRKFVDDVTNGTSRPLNAYTWPGGSSKDFLLTKSRAHSFDTLCSEMQITYANGTTEHISWFYLSHKFFGKNAITIYIYPAEHASPLCGFGKNNGDSLFLKEHGDLSQRLVRDTSDLMAINKYGWIRLEDINTGKIRPSEHLIVSTDAVETNIFGEVRKIRDNYYGLQKILELRSLWLKTEEEFENALTEFNNFGFLILSITALVSSTIVVVVTAKKANAGELAVVIVEFIVLILFLYVLTHALVVFSRGDDFIVDYEVSQETNHTYGDINVRGSFQRRDVLVGKRQGLAVMLVIAEICAIVAFIIVFANVIRLFRIRWRPKKVISPITEDKEFSD